MSRTTCRGDSVEQDVGPQEERKSKTTACAYRKKQAVAGEESERGEIPNSQQPEQMDGGSSAPNVRRKHTDDVVGVNAQRRSANRQKATQMHRGRRKHTETRWKQTEPWLSHRNVAQSHKNGAQTHRNTALAHKSAAPSHRNGAQTHRKMALTHRNAAQSHRNGAQTQRTAFKET